MEKPLLLLALVPLAIGLALISVAIGSQKTGKRAQKDPFACLLDAHGRCRHVDHREPTRMMLHAAARLPAIGRGQSTALRAIPAIAPPVGFKPPRHLEP